MAADSTTIRATGTSDLSPLANATLVLNAGSSSIKFSVFAERGGELALTVRGQAEGLYTAPRFTAIDAGGKTLADKSWGDSFVLGHDGALDHLTAFLRTELSEHRLTGVGHRVVHGGLEYFHPVRVDATVLASLEQYIPLAPLHQPHNLAPIRLLLERAPGLPQVACFDTAFHHGQPSVAQAFALPREITDRGVRRYGFHGLSYEYISKTLPRYDANAARGKAVVLHLGNGSSMCAMAAGRSIASTMGLTAVDGLPMGTRCGSIDPGVILYLMDELRMDARAIEKLIYQESGLLGVSGISSDMRTLEASKDPAAKTAIDLYAYRIGRELGSLAAALGGLDAIVFTAGIGENSRSLRERVCRDAAWLGVELDPEANEAQGPRISRAASRVSAWIIPTNEELMIARHTRSVLMGSVVQAADRRLRDAQ
jgi:acetate kinase